MRSFLLALAVSAVLPSTALAAGPGAVVIIPPSNPGANQYLENVPTATGTSSGQTIADRATSGRRGTTQALPAATQAGLSRYGSDGRRAALFAAGTAPAVLTAGTAARGGSAVAGRGVGDGGAGGGHGATGGRTAGGGVSSRGARGTAGGGRTGGRTSPATSRSGGAQNPTASAGPGSGPATSIARAVIGTGAGGIDLWLPVALAVSAAGIAAVALLRRRTG